VLPDEDSVLAAFDSLAWDRGSKDLGDAVAVRRALAAAKSFAQSGGVAEPAALLFFLGSNLDACFPGPHGIECLARIVELQLGRVGRRFAQDTWYVHLYAQISLLRESALDLEDVKLWFEAHTVEGRLPSRPVQ
jgi:hypothetical protein